MIKVMTKIKKISKFFCIIFQILFWLQPLIIVFFWLTYKTDFGFISSLIQSSFGILEGPLAINSLTRILGIAISIPPTAIIMFMFFQIIKILKNYEHEKIFVLSNAIAFRQLGIIVIVWRIADIIYKALATLVVTFQNPPTQKIFAITINSDDFYTFILGGFIILIGWVMIEAYKIHEEQNLTI
jgi:hypothetical protein